MTTLFISDLHLSQREPSLTQAFFYFLEHMATEAETLYILGDFFDSYVGDDDRNIFTQSIAHALSRASEAGLTIFLMHGNRDFLIGQSFADAAGATLIPDPSCITVYGHRILLMHGDSLCTADHVHQRFRSVSRNRLVQKIFLMLPLSFRKKIAKRLRAGSKKHHTSNATAIMDVTEQAVSKAFSSSQASYLIHGHTHRPAIHASHGTQKRIVLGSWENDANYLRLSENHEPEWIKLPKATT